MTPGITFNIYVMSYQRPHKIMTRIGLNTVLMSLGKKKLMLIEMPA